MSKNKKSHDENRSKVCLMCFQKGSSMISLVPSKEILKRVQNFFIENYDPSDLKMPAGLCSGCRLKLTKKEQKSKESQNAEYPLPEVNLPDPVDFFKLQFPSTITRSRGGELMDCNCDICIIATAHPGNQPSKFGRAAPPHTMGRPRNDIPRLAVRKPVKVCGFCQQIIGKGIRHPQPCTISDRREQMQRLSLEDPRGRELEAAAVVREGAAKTGKASLATKGSSSLNVSIDQPSTSKALFKDQPVSKEQFQKLGTRLRLSQNQEDLLAQGLRGWSGRNYLEANLAPQLSVQRKEAAHFFAIERIELDVIGKPKEQVRKFMPVFYCKDVPGLFRFIAERRQYHSLTDLMVLIGFDKGGKDPPTLKRVVNIQKIHDEFSSPHHRKKRSSYQQGAFPRAFKDSGVNRTIILLNAPWVKETNYNLHQLTKLLKFSYKELGNVFDANDLLLTPNFVGIGTAGSTYPCHHCEMPAKDFGKLENDMLFKGGRLRTLQSIHDNALKYQEACRHDKAHMSGKKKLSSAPWFNCEHIPLYLLHGVDIKTLILLLAPPPELHILLGLGNDFFDLLVDRLKARKPEYLDIITKFLKDHSLLRQQYFTGGRTDFPGKFDGNHCKFFLDLVDDLERYLREVEGAFETVEPILIAMRAFNRVRKQCFGVDLDPNYENSIKEFGRLWKKCDRSITLKCHELFVHVVQFLENPVIKSKFPNKGLGFWAEQASEGSHSLWEKFYQRFKRQLDAPDFEQKFFDCNVAFNEKAYGDSQGNR